MLILLGIKHSCHIVECQFYLNRLSEKKTTLAYGKSSGLKGFKFGHVTMTTWRFSGPTFFANIYFYVWPISGVRSRSLLVKLIVCNGLCLCLASTKMCSFSFIACFQNVKYHPKSSWQTYPNSVYWQPNYFRRHKGVKG